MGGSGFERSPSDARVQVSEGPFGRLPASVDWGSGTSAANSCMYLALKELNLSGADRWKSGALLDEWINSDSELTGHGS